MIRILSAWPSVGTLLLMWALFGGPTHAAPTLGAVPLTYFGMHIHRADTGTPWPPFPFGTWRLWDAGVGWSSVEPEKGRWYFARLDRDLAIAKQARVDVILVLGLTPTWASARPTEKSGYRPGNAAEPREMEDWRRYVRTVVTRYKGQIPYYEIWNEPSDKQFFTGSVEKLVELAAEAYKIIKEVDPAAEVLSPANSGGGRDLAHYDRFLEMGGKQWFDISAYHFYTWTAVPEAMLPVLDELKGILTKHGIQHRSIWSTEAGWWLENSDGTPDHPTMKSPRRKLTAEQSQAYLARTLILGRAEGLDRFYPYSWDNLYGLGMREQTSGAAKPVALAYAKTVDLMLGQVVEPCRANQGVWTCRLTKGKRVTWVAWRENGATSDWPIPPSWGSLRFRRLVDDSRAIAKSKVVLGDMPLVFESATPSE
jgi:hypothetical protein